MAQTTTVRMNKATRDRLNKLSRVLDVATADEVVARALDLLEADVFWREWERAHTGAALGPAESAWEAASARDWPTPETTES